VESKVGEATQASASFVWPPFPTGAMAEGSPSNNSNQRVRNALPIRRAAASTGTAAAIAAKATHSPLSPATYFGG